MMASLDLKIAILRVASASLSSKSPLSIEDRVSSYSSSLALAPSRLSSRALS
jgi:hypothetical protein